MTAVAARVYTYLPVKKTCGCLGGLASVPEFVGDFAIRVAATLPSLLRSLVEAAAVARHDSIV